MADRRALYYILIAKQKSTDARRASQGPDKPATRICMPRIGYFEIIMVVVAFMVRDRVV